MQEGFGRFFFRNLLSHHFINRILVELVWKRLNGTIIGQSLASKICS